MSDKKKENLFAQLARQQTAKAEQEEATAVAVPEADDAASSPAPAAPDKPRPAVRKKPDPVRGKRQNPEYCQANCYVPKKLRRAVDRALLDIDGLDYSSLVEDLLRKWLKSKGISE